MKFRQLSVMHFQRIGSPVQETGFGLFDEIGLKTLLDINGTPVEYVDLLDFGMVSHAGCFTIVQDFLGKPL